jgi:hypothetical protein
MIIQGGSRSNAGQLGRYLLNEAANDRVDVLGVPDHARNLTEALRDMERMGQMTRGTKTLYHAQINPAPGYDMRPEDWDRSVDVLAEKMGLEAQPRAVVLHEKDGRTHAHVVFQRTDVERGRLISDSHNYTRHREAAQQLVQELGHEKVNRKVRGNSFTQEEARKAAADRTDPAKIRTWITDLYERSATAEEFQKGLEGRFVMAKPKKRAYALLDSYGQDYNLARMVKTAKTSELREFFAPVEHNLMDQDEYRAAIRDGNDERIAEKTAAIKQEHEAKRRKLHEWTKKQVAGVTDLEAKQEYWANYEEVSKTLREEQAQERADWEAKDRIEKIRQLEEERIRREREQQREQEWKRGRDRGLSL